MIKKGQTSMRPVLCHSSMGARNDLPRTDMDSFIPSHDLSTMTKHITTHTNRSFDHTGYLYDPMQSLDCIESLVLTFNISTLYDLSSTLYDRLGSCHNQEANLFDYDTNFPRHIGSARRLHTSLSSMEPTIV